MLFLLVLCFISPLFSVCSTQYDSDENCDETGNCTILIHRCIRQYSDLESYIINNKELTRTLAATFYRTGRAPSRYVKINYDFLNTTGLSDGANDTNCTRHQTTYIWSESVLYLLGPNPLFWLTLFAVNIPEASVTVQLPCLCADVQFDLLGRLTYLVSLLLLLIRICMG